LSEKLNCISFREVGHDVAHILVGIPLKHVCINEDKEKDEDGQRSLGHVMNDNPMTPEDWDKYSILDPGDFKIFFKDDFIKLAGLVAEGIYRRKFNYKAAKNDFRQRVGTSSQASGTLRIKIYRFYAGIHFSGASR
jgi:hypothetical protein